MSGAGFSSDGILACGSCGHVYDPAIGDAAAGVPPGTPFARLPASWRCRGCGGPAHDFFTGSNSDRVTALVEAYRALAGAEMRDLPVAHPGLEVWASPFHGVDEGLIGAVLAPWTLNIVLIPTDPRRLDGCADGDAVTMRLPAGAYNFKAARHGALGVLATLAAISDMRVFGDQDDAVTAAELALATLLRPPTAPVPTAPAPVLSKTPVSRRGLFGARSS